MKSQATLTNKFVSSLSNFQLLILSLIIWLLLFTFKYKEKLKNAYYVKSDLDTAIKDKKKWTMHLTHNNTGIEKEEGIEEKRHQ